ncbi:MAG: hypothetical protein AAGJ46_04255 [Planctomycetota bacterium]
MTSRIATARAFAAVLTIMAVAGPAPGRELWSDSWVATDALGRTISTHDSVGDRRADKHVGMFYFLWHGFHGTELYDNTKLLEANPTDPQYGPESRFHWWGEPEAGYYRATDPWVIRRNNAMLVDAGVDFIYLDASNAITYPNEFRALADTFLQIRAEGGTTPQITFLTRSSSPRTIDRLLGENYTQRQYTPLWFEWEEKPLMLGYPDQDGESVSQAARDRFTFRESWAWDDGDGKWQWIDTFPQDFGWSGDPNHPEQAPAAVASHPVNNRGRSYRQGSQPAIDAQGLTAFTDQGRHFAEQIDGALQIDPDVLFLTGWNEWVAQRKIADAPRQFLGQTIDAGDTYFVDAYNQEYSRDIEPMRGGHTDNYYYQLVDAVRRYKGATPPPEGSSRLVSIDGAFDEWANVSTEYRDTLGDTLHRDFAGWGDNHYVNTTGRNDLITAKTANNADELFFYAETAAPITPSSDNDWMMLLIDADGDATTGWAGYDYVVNRAVVDGNTTTLERALPGGGWRAVATLPYAVDGEQLELAVPRDLVGLGDEDFGFHFQWLDNAPIDGDFEATFTSGDAAPNRRFRYAYQAAAPLPGDVDGDGAVTLADLTTLRDNLFEPGARADGDLTGDGLIDFEDYLQWKSNYATATAASAPEPASALSVAAVGLGFAGRTRRNRLSR